MRLIPRAAPGVLLALAACGGGATASSLARAITDTLPGGIPRVTSSGPTSWTDSSGAKLVEESRFGGEDGADSELGSPRSMAVDEAGRVYVVDTKPALIKVYSPDGKMIRTIGREGEGPGEFRVGFIAVRGGVLALQDPQVARTTLWDTAGTYIRSWHSSCCYWDHVQIDRQRRIYVPTMVQTKPGESSRGRAYVRWSLEGVALDTMWIPTGPEGKTWTVKAGSGKNMSMMMTSVPFEPEQRIALDPDGGVVFGWSGAYSMVRSKTGIDSARVFGRVWTPDPASDERKKIELDGQIKDAKGNWDEATVRAAFRLSDIPSTLPAFETLRVDEAGRIWARRYPIMDTTRTTFDVFDSTGAYLGPVSSTISFNAWGQQAWTRDGVVAIIEDQDGRPNVVKLKLTIGGKPR